MDIVPRVALPRSILFSLSQTLVSPTLVHFDLCQADFLKRGQRILPSWRPPFDHDGLGQLSAKSVRYNNDYIHLGHVPSTRWTTTILPNIGTRAVAFNGNLSPGRDRNLNCRGAFLFVLAKDLDEAF